MREIKFRAWDGKKMVYDSEAFAKMWLIGFGGTVRQVHGSTDWEKKEHTHGTHLVEGLELMQFTGLHDKNGKEIYEGDVVRLYNWGVSSEEIGVAKVVWDTHYLQWDYEMIEGGEIDDRYDIWRAVREVIGNIYENPELLTN